MSDAVAARMAALQRKLREQSRLNEADTKTEHRKQSEARERADRALKKAATGKVSGRKKRGTMPKGAAAIGKQEALGRGLTEEAGGAFLCASDLAAREKEAAFRRHRDSGAARPEEIRMDAHIAHELDGIGHERLREEYKKSMGNQGEVVRDGVYKPSASAVRRVAKELSG
ncbi:hypothetical protein KIPB_013795, partial [Kipferlia bialata]|eukprot:g13795.t1